MSLYIGVGMRKDGGVDIEIVCAAVPRLETCSEIRICILDSLAYVGCRTHCLTRTYRPTLINKIAQQILPIRNRHFIMQINMQSQTGYEIGQIILHQ